MKQQRISIWYFIGILLGIYGILILGSGIADVLNRTEYAVKLAYLHAPIWWGALLVILGLIYILKFRPRKTQD